jgi:hypothetical protein
VSTFVANARRTLRLPVRCEVRIEVDGIGYDGFAEDLSARGCLLVAPIRLRTESHVRLLLRREGAPSPLSVGAVVVWRKSRPSGHHGMIFDPGDRLRAQAWFDQSMENHTELLHLDRVPDRLPLQARVYLSGALNLPPRLADEETVVARLACGPSTVSDLCSLLGPDTRRARRALFSLLNRGAVTLDLAEMADRDAGRRPPEQAPLADPEDGSPGSALDAPGG